jgi:hypothetical protein
MFSESSSETLAGSSSGYYIKAKIVDLEVIRDKLISQLTGGVSPTVTGDSSGEDLVMSVPTPLTVSETQLFFSISQC